MGGTGSKQEDQIITVALEKLSAPKKFTYVPYGGGGTVATQLVGKHVNSSVNNPIEAVSQWKAGALRPLCIFDAKRSVYTNKVTADMAWSDIPTCKEGGVDTQYQMLRGIFMSPGVKPEHVAFYVDLFKKAMATDDWKQFMEQGAFNQTFMSGESTTSGWKCRQAALRPDEKRGLPGVGKVAHWGSPHRDRLVVVPHHPALFLRQGVDDHTKPQPEPGPIGRLACQIAIRCNGSMGCRRPKVRDPDRGKVPPSAR